MEIFVTLLLGGIAVLALYRVYTSRSKRLPPGPRGLSVLKAFRDGTLHKQAKVWHQQYGDLVLCRTVLGDFCFLNSARLVREMYASKEREQFTNNRPPTFSGWYLSGYKDMLTADPHLCPEWSKIRRLFHYALKFYGDGVERFESTVQTELQRLTSRIEASAGEDVNMDRLLTYSLFSILFVLLTGECPEPESESVRLMEEYGRDCNEFFDNNVEGVLGTFPFLRFVPGTRYRDLCQKTARNKKRIVDELFTKAKATHTAGHARGIVDVLLDEQLKGDNHWLTDEIVQGIILNIITAGFLTSFGSLTALFLFLVHNPDVTQKVQKEVDDIIGKRPPCVSDRSKLPYTEAVVMEMLRNTVNVIIPHLTTEDVEIEGYTVCKGSLVFSNNWTFNRNPEVYPDPDQFRPERFMDDVTGQLVPQSHPVRQSQLSFGVGRRSCPGENFARTRIFLYVTTLLQQFDILPPVKHQLPPPDPELYQSGVVLQPKPYHLVFRPRS